MIFCVWCVVHFRHSDDLTLFLFISTRDFLYFTFIDMFPCFILFRFSLIILSVVDRNLLSPARQRNLYFESYSFKHLIYSIFISLIYLIFKFQQIYSLFLINLISFYVLFHAIFIFHYYLLCILHVLIRVPQIIMSFIYVFI